ncbi:MAG: MFS transporter [Clostridia bacterium]|nr:MFS transporter [Clostridia bacterium]
MSKVKSLDKKWKEVVFAASGFGPNLMMILMGAYFTDAINPAGLNLADNPYHAISTICYILPAIFPILWAISKAFDGIIDIPFAKLTDSLNTKWGRRRPPILICFIPMVISYILCWIPFGSYVVFKADPAGHSAQLFNTIWIVVFALIFFSTYTMCLIAFYGSLSTVCDGEKQRLRVSSYKATFDTITYAIVYALVPLIFALTKQHVDKIAIFGSVLMLTMLIPLFMIKEGEKYGYPEKDGLSEEHVSIIQSIKTTFGNKVFSSWLVVNCTAFFGLQMFLVSMNALLSGSMEFNNLEIALVETCAFAPVPMMLYLFNKVKQRKGVRFTYQTCLIAFAIAILSFDIASVYVSGGNKPFQMTVSIVGALIGSWEIGAFFMMPLMVPAQVSSVEEKLTKRNNSAMYFAAQAVTTSVIGAIASSLVYENIKMLFISKEAGGIVWADGTTENGVFIGIKEEAALLLNSNIDNVYNFGTLLVPIIVSVMCLFGFIMAFRMPKDFTPELVAKELKRQNPNLDISAAVTEEADIAKEKDVTFVNVAYWILSGSIFGFIWSAFQLRSFKNKNTLIANSTPLTWMLSAIIPFFSIFTFKKLYGNLKKQAEEKNVKITDVRVLMVLSVIFPILPVNVISLALLQRDMNKVDA